MAKICLCVVKFSDSSSNQYYNGLWNSIKSFGKVIMSD